VEYLAMKVDGRSQTLNGNETYKSLNDMQNKLVENESNIKRIESYMEAKKNDVGFKDLKAKCIGYVEDFNRDAIKECVAHK